MHKKLPAMWREALLMHEINLFVSVSDSSAGKVVWRYFDLDPVICVYADVLLRHSAAKPCKHFMPVFQCDEVESASPFLGDGPVGPYSLFLSHLIPSVSCRCAAARICIPSSRWRSCRRTLRTAAFRSCFGISRSPARPWTS